MEWISLKDRKPPYGEMVILCSNSGVVQHVSFFLSSCDEWQDCLEEFDPCGFDEFTHWMPLPKPPKD